jgi:hypothetical protein
MHGKKPRNDGLILLFLCWEALAMGNCGIPELFGELVLSTGGNTRSAKKILSYSAVFGAVGIPLDDVHGFTRILAGEPVLRSGAKEWQTGQQLTQGM